MKPSITILALVTLWSCNSTAKTDLLEENTTAIEADSVDNDLVGEWGIYVMGNAYCNACPRIQFKADESGTILFPNGTTGLIRWTKINEKLKIINVSPIGGEALLSEGEYLMNLKKKQEFFELTLTKVGTSYDYILRR